MSASLHQTICAQDDRLAACRAVWQAQGYVPLPVIFQAAARLATGVSLPMAAARLMAAFNGSAAARRAIDLAARHGQTDAAILAGHLAHSGTGHMPLVPMSRSEYTTALQKQAVNPAGFWAGLTPSALYPVPEGAAAGLEAAQVRSRLAEGRARFGRFVAGRSSDTAVLLGNGPSLRQMDFDLFRGQDLYISNYAIRHAALRSMARGVAVSNALVAAQEPYSFQLTDLWTFHPVWMGHILHDRPQTIWLEAQGGALFFSGDIGDRIAWHSTVTYFWLQILYAAGYRRVLLAGVDNSYVQAPGAREGDVLHQAGDDPNHFDPGYFRGKHWQAADTDRMAETYALARAAYEADGREILNCGIGGQLETFPRGDLAQELSRKQKQL